VNGSDTVDLQTLQGKVSAGLSLTFTKADMKPSFTPCSSRNSSSNVLRICIRLVLQRHTHNNNNNNNKKNSNNNHPTDRR